MLARTSVERCFLAFTVCVCPRRSPSCTRGNLKAFGDGLAYLEEPGVVPERVIRECVAGLGEPSRRHLGLSEMV